MRTPILLNQTKTRNIRWVKYVLPAMLMMLFISANAATYYWVGGTGNWHDLGKWAATSGGPGNAFAQIPSIGDHVIFDRNSFTASGQTVSCSTPSPNAACANMDWSDATFVYKGTSAPTFSLSTNISVSGNIIMPSNLKFTNNGSVILEGGGSKNLNIACTVSGTGSFQVHHQNGTWTLQSNLSFANGILALNKGTLNTNNKTVTLRYFNSPGTDPRVLNLGSSKIQIRPVSANNMAFWNITNAQGITINPGSSEIEFYSTVNNIQTVFNGQGLSYNNVKFDLRNGSPTSTSTANSVTINGNNTFNKVVFTKGTALFSGSNTFQSCLQLRLGHRYRFAIGQIQSFADTASFLSQGTQASPIYIQSTSNSNYATFTKPVGIVCTDHTFISNVMAIGGASWNSPSTNFNQTPSFTSGWNFGSSNAQINATIQGGVKCKGEPFNLKLTFSGTTFPVNCVIENMWSGKRDTIEDITNAVYYHPVNPLISTYYRIREVSSSGCYNSVVSALNVQDLVSVPLYGKLATWLGLRSSDWYDCNNWSNNAVPEDTVDVTIIPNTQMTQPVIATGVASSQQIEIAYDADLTLFGSNTELHVHGDFINNGTFNPNDARVAFIGNNVAAISGGEYGTLVVNNTTPQGIALQDTVVVTGTLTLNNGVVNTNGNLIKITNPSQAAITNFGEDNYINGALERAISDSGTYSFPVGDDVIYALCEIRPTGSTGGVQSLRVQFIHKPGTDDGMNLEFNGVEINSVHPAGIWLIEPDQQPLFGGGVSGDYELTFHLDGFPNLANYNFYILTRHDTSANAADWTVAGVQNGSQIVDGKITVSGITHFSQWGVGQGGGSSLPVTMTEFKASAVDNKFIQLKWTTQTEIDNSGFMVERSIDGEEFTTIGFVAGFGNSTETHHYVYNDKNVEQKKRYYYRLKQIDFDGGYEYSKMVSAMLNNDKTHRIGEFIPNPTSSIANVEIYSAQDEKVTFEFQNVAGQVVKKGDVMLKKGSNTYRLDVNDLPAGNYLVSINTSHKTFTKKLVVKN